MAFRVSDGVGTQNIVLFVAQWLACALPCQRFTYGLTGRDERIAPWRHPESCEPAMDTELN
jgi:hypothetical protein